MTRCRLMKWCRPLLDDSVSRIVTRGLFPPSLPLSSNRPVANLRPPRRILQRENCPEGRRSRSARIRSMFSGAVPAVWTWRVAMTSVRRSSRMASAASFARWGSWRFDRKRGLTSPIRRPQYLKLRLSIICSMRHGAGVALTSRKLSLGKKMNAANGEGSETATIAASIPMRAKSALSMVNSVYFIPHCGAAGRACIDLGDGNTSLGRAF